VAHLSAVLFFLVGVLSSVLIERALTTRQYFNSLPIVLSIEVILTIAAYLAFASRAVRESRSFVVCMSLALGMQNGAFQRTGGHSVTHLLTRECIKADEFGSD